ncbi:ABC transporter permease [Clostridium carnis]
MKILKKFGSFIFGFIIFNVLWQIASLMLDTKALPAPMEIYRSLPKLIEKDINLHIAASINRIGLGLIISIIIGGILGLIMGYSKVWNKILNPLIYFTYPIPKMALLPVVMILFGLGNGSKITLIVLITVFQVIIAVRDAILNIPKESYNPLISLGASKIQIFLNVTVPAIMPEILTNLRLSIGTALSVLFFAENFGTSFGVGYYIQDAWARISYIDLYSGIVVLSFIGLVLFLIIDLLEALLCSWRK